MSNVYLAADLHLGHRAVVKPGRRDQFKTVQEHDEYIVDEWNKIATKRDIFYILGDVLFSQDSFETLGRLKGIKKLVMGNHDIFSMKDYMKHFTNICSSYRISGNFVLSHIPIHPSEFPRYRANIHGHKHNRRMDDPRYFCVSMEQINMRPILLDDVITQLNDRLPPAEEKDRRGGS